MAFISSNWTKLVQQHRVDPVNPSAAHHSKKRKLSQTSPDSSSPSSSPSPPLPPPTHPSPSTSSPHSSSSVFHPLPSPSLAVPTLVLAMDCEMVGVGPDGLEHALARCSLVNSLGHVLLDRYVLPLEPITDYRTAVSGVRPAHMHSASPFKAVQTEVAGLLKGRVLVGHGLHTDLAVLQLSHPRTQVRDTARWKRLCPGRPRGLKVLVKEHLGLEIQEGEHDSVVDARATLALYLKFKAEWEAERKLKKRKEAAEPEPQATSGNGAANGAHLSKLLYTSEGAVQADEGRGVKRRAGDGNGMNGREQTKSRRTKAA